MNPGFLLFFVVALFVSFKHEALAGPPLTIVNGTDAEEGEFPYMVQLIRESGPYTCGGAIIGSEWILTAGHCVKSEFGDIGFIVYGTNKLYDIDDGYPNTSIKVKNWFIHPKYTTYNDVDIYDIGILQLEEPIPFSSNAQPIKLVEANATTPFHVEGVLAGWGFNKILGGQSSNLQKINLQLLTDQECKEKINDVFGKDSYNSTHHYCSNDFLNGQCLGDSGSPYVINNVTYGTVSWSYKPCGKYPGTYSRITNPEYRNWIKNVTNI